MLVRLWGDDGGALLASEWVFVATILVLGAITGLVAVRQAAIKELHDLANAHLAQNQTYSFGGMSNCCSSTAGAACIDYEDGIYVRSTHARPWGYNNQACD
jgi:hypothetical protein